MVPPTVRAVVFDAVGTLIFPDPPAPVVYAEVGRRFGQRLDGRAIRPRFAAAFARQEAVDQELGLRTSEERELERWRRIVAEVLDEVSDADACFQELFEHFRRPDAWRCDPDAAAVLDALAQRGYVLGMASNYDRRLRSVVAGLPALKPIQRLIISSEVGWRKPAPPFFAAVCRAVGLPAEQVLFVGDDRANDFNGARAAGLEALLVDPNRREVDPTIPRVEHLADLVRSDG
jgi:putative hydrolase of the HAD superfamily